MYGLVPFRLCSLNYWYYTRYGWANSGVLVRQLPCRSRQRYLHECVLAYSKFISPQLTYSCSNWLLGSVRHQQSSYTPSCYRDQLLSEYNIDGWLCRREWSTIHPRGDCTGKGCRLPRRCHSLRDESELRRGDVCCCL